MKTSGYYINLSTFSLEKLEGSLKSARLLPSQKVLQEDLENRFALLKKHAIKNLQDLQTALKTKQHVLAFADTTGLPVDFLTILRREVNSYQPKSIQLKDIPGINEDTISKLAVMNIKHTLQLYSRVNTPQARAALAKDAGLSGEVVLELAKFTDVVRLRWVGPKFARLLIESEYDTVEKIAAADGKTLFAHLAQVNKEKGIYSGGLGLDDFIYWINDHVKNAPLAIEY